MRADLRDHDLTDGQRTGAPGHALGVLRQAVLMSPRSRGRKPKKSGKSKRTDKRPSPAAGRATAVDPGYSGLSIELPRSPLDDVLTRHVRPDRFGPSHRRVLTASAALLRADSPRALEQATAELIGAELRNPEVQGLRFDLWAHDLIESARRPDYPVIGAEHSPRCPAARRHQPLRPALPRQLSSRPAT
jgi:hypothetical protein